PYSAARYRGSSRVDDSGLFDRSGRRDDPTNCWNLFRHSSVYGTDTLRVLRDCVLDWLCATSHRCGSLGSVHSAAGRRNIYVAPQQGDLSWQRLIISSFHRTTAKRRRSYWRSFLASNRANHLACFRLSTSTTVSRSTLWKATNSMCTTIVSRSPRKSLKRSSQDCGRRTFLIAAAHTDQWT